MQFPDFLKPYQRFWILGRFDRPIGIWLSLFPALCGLALGAHGHPDFWHLILFFLGCTVVRAGACVINDIIDQEVDAKVTRTKKRPLPAGTVSREEAMIFAGILMGLALCALLLLPFATILFGIIGALLIATYPWLKRLTYWPQAFLGIMMNWGIWLGITVYHKPIGFESILFFMGCVLWTIGYDTIYAFQDLEDDVLVGVKSSAIVVQDNPKGFLTWTYGGGWLLWSLAGIFHGLSVSYIIALTLCAGILIAQIDRLDTNDKVALGNLFRSNQWIGIILFLGLVL